MESKELIKNGVLVEEFSLHLMNKYEDVKEEAETVGGGKIIHLEVMDIYNAGKAEGETIGEECGEKRGEERGETRGENN